MSSGNNFRCIFKFFFLFFSGVYVSSLVHSDDSRVLVTMDEQLPTIEISDSPATGTIGVDFVWLAKVGHGTSFFVTAIARPLK